MNGLIYRCDPVKNLKCAGSLACQEICFHTLREECTVDGDKGMTEEEFLRDQNQRRQFLLNKIQSEC